ncbi:hypothetical protein [Aquirhabdus sp.]|uniref:hypothetical protein n=1 Tax=Aquirhabdus sp. TaxID=2824160 RepID=UPI00396D00F5
MKKLMLLGFALCLSSLANAAIVTITAVPTGWRMANYMGDGALLVRNTGSTCATGKITMPTNNEAQRNRFWALILAAKATSSTVVIEYDDSTTLCTIVSFSMKES